MPDPNLLDDNIYSSAKIKEILNNAGLLRHYELENGVIEVQEADAIKVSIRYDAGGVRVVPNFPQIGNGPQILVTILILVVSFVLGIPFSWVVALLGGQAFSYFWFTPKINALKDRVETAIREYHLNK